MLIFREPYSHQAQYLWYGCPFTGKYEQVFEVVDEFRSVTLFDRVQTGKQVKIGDTQIYASNLKVGIQLSSILNTVCFTENIGDIQWAFYAHFWQFRFAYSCLSFRTRFYSYYVVTPTI